VLLANVLVHIKTFTLFLLSVIYLLWFETKRVFLFSRLSKYSLKRCLIFYTIVMLLGCGTINLFSMHVYITDYLCVAYTYNTSTFFPTEYCCTGIKFIGITGHSFVLIVYVGITGLLVCGIWIM